MGRPIVCDNRAMGSVADEAREVSPDLTSEQRDEILRSEALWRKAHGIVEHRPTLDVGDVYHVLRNLELTPAERLRRGLTRVRARPNAR